MRVAIIGGDERIHRVPWPEYPQLELALYTKDDAHRLHHSAKSGGVDKIIVLTRWMGHADEDVVRSAGMPILRWERGLNQLAESLPEVVGMSENELQTPSSSDAAKIDEVPGEVIRVAAVVGGEGLLDAQYKAGVAVLPYVVTQLERLLQDAKDGSLDQVVLLVDPALHRERLAPLVECRLPSSVWARGIKQFIAELPASVKHVDKIVPVVGDDGAVVQFEKQEAVVRPYVEASDVLGVMSVERSLTTLEVARLLNTRNTASVQEAIQELIEDGVIFTSSGEKGSRSNPPRYQRTIVVKKPPEPHPMVDLNATEEHASGGAVAPKPRQEGKKGGARGLKTAIVNVMKADVSVGWTAQAMADRLGEKNKAAVEGAFSALLAGGEIYVSGGVPGSPKNPRQMKLTEVQTRVIDISAIPATGEWKKKILEVLALDPGKEWLAREMSAFMGFPTKGAEAQVFRQKLQTALSKLRSADVIVDVGGQPGNKADPVRFKLSPYVTLKAEDKAESVSSKPEPPAPPPPRKVEAAPRAGGPRNSDEAFAAYQKARQELMLAEQAYTKAKAALETAAEVMHDFMKKGM